MSKKRKRPDSLVVTLKLSPESLKWFPYQPEPTGNGAILAQLQTFSRIFHFIRVIPPPLPENFLHVLPAEVRNMIYEFALTTEDKTLKYTANDASGHKKMNQLQYVNKQLHHECSGLDLKFNPTIHIITVPNEGKTSVEVFLKLLMRLGPKKQAYLGTVVLQSGRRRGPIHGNVFNWAGKVAPIEDYRMCMIELAGACRLLPHIKVKYMLTNLTGFRFLGQDTVFVLAVGYSKLLRNDPMRHLWTVTITGEPLCWFREIHRFMARWMGGPQKHEWMGLRPDQYHHELQASNLRFHLMPEHLEDRWSSMHARILDWASLREATPLWEAQLRKWVEEGM